MDVTAGIIDRNANRRWELQLHYRNARRELARAHRAFADALDNDEHRTSEDHLIYSTLLAKCEAAMAECNAAGSRMMSLPYDLIYPDGSPA